MIGYASRTGTKRNLAVLRRAGWRIMVSATGCLRHEGFAYALDNGAWTAYRRGEAFGEKEFAAAYEKLGAGADFTVLPDIVAGGLRSLEFSLAWRERLGAPRCMLLLAVQDGMVPADVAVIVGPPPLLGIFIGGTAEWKEHSMIDWGDLAHSRGAYLHVGRVNTARRLYQCERAGAHSFDGTSVSRYAETLEELDSARKQRDLFTRRDEAWKR